MPLQALFPHKPPLPLITVEPLCLEHLPELAAVLAHPAVYQHIGGDVPTLDELARGLAIALAGPPAGRPNERWLHYLMREPESGRMIGRLEATVVPGCAEVAFLVTPTLWGRGYASAGLSWLHAELARTTGHREFWAATVPANTRCQSLLLRSGYLPVPPSQAPALASYEAGDQVFHKQA